MTENCSPVIGEYPLSGSLVVCVSDETGHYFGGYYHVRLMARCDVPITEGLFASQGEFMKVRAILGETVSFERALEKMAVPEHELDDVKHSLLHSFETNLLPYMKHSGFADGFVKNQYCSHSKKRNIYGK